MIPGLPAWHASTTPGRTSYNTRTHGSGAFAPALKPATRVRGCRERWRSDACPR